MAKENLEPTDDTILNLKVHIEVIKFLLQTATRVEITEGGTYLYLPFWVEVTDEVECMVRMYSPDQMPEELRNALKQFREGNDETTRESSTDTPR